MNVVVRSSELKRILSNVLPFAAEHDSRPALCAVHLVVHPGKQRIWAVAVDPYALAYDSAETEEAGGIFERTLPREIVELLLRELGIPRRADRDLTTIEEDRVVIGNVTAAYTPVEGYPDFRQVIPDRRQRGAAPQPVTRLNPLFLTRLERVKKNSGYPFATMHFYGELKPVEITVGPTFKCVVMPLRADGQMAEPADPPVIGELPVPEQVATPAVLH